MLEAVWNFASFCVGTHYILTAVFLVLCAVLYNESSKRRRLNLPPGPWCLPIVGFLPFMSAEPYREFAELGKKYGGIFGLQIGSRYSVVLNDFAAIKDSSQKDAFLGRPPGIFELSKETSHFAEKSGNEWKGQRRFILSSLRTLGMGKNKAEEMMAEKIGNMLNRLQNIPAGTKVDLNEVLLPYICSTMLSVLCSKSFEPEDELSETIHKEHRAFVSFLTGSFLAVYLPKIKPFLFWWKPDLLENMQIVNEMENYLWKEIEEHETTFDENNKRDMMDHYISAGRNPATANDPQFSKGSINGNCHILLNAGSDTSSCAIQWFLMVMAINPKIQEKVYDEILKVLGPNKMAGWEDKERLPYTFSAISESFRMQTLVPLGDQRWTLEDTSVLGFDIPKDTMVFYNLWAVHKDPKLWKNPETFNPDRFLSADRKSVVLPEYFIPFGYGKRNCPGDKIGHMTTFAYSTSILQRFKVVAPKEGISFDGTFAIVYYPKKAILHFEPRSAT